MTALDQRAGATTDNRCPEVGARPSKSNCKERTIVLGEALVSSQRSPHTRTTEPPAVAKLVPAIVREAPPASEVAVGETLVTVKSAPWIVGSVRGAAAVS